MSKKTLFSGYAFQAATRTLDLSGVPSFDIGRLAGVFDISRSVDIDAPGEPGLGFDTVTSGVIRLQADTTQLADSDVLAVIRRRQPAFAGRGRHGGAPGHRERPAAADPRRDSGVAR